MSDGAIADQLKRGLPALVAGVLMLLTATPAPFAWLPTYPLVLLMAVFFLSIYAPRSLPFGVVFALGLLTDMLLSAPLGLHALLAVLAQQLVLRMVRVVSRQAFRVVWAGFAVLCVGYHACMLLVLHAVMAQPPAADSVLPLLISTVVFYPIFHIVFSRLIPST